MEIYAIRTMEYVQRRDANVERIPLVERIVLEVILLIEARRL